MDVGRWGRTTAAVPADAMSSPRSCSSNSRSVASRRVVAFFIFRAPVVFLRRCMVRLLLLLPHRAAADRPKLVAAAREDQGRTTTARRHAEEQVARLLVCRLDDATGKQHPRIEEGLHTPRC